MNQVYKYVTDKIIEQLEKGVIPWRKPWVIPARSFKGSKFVISERVSAINYVTRKPYRGVNTLLLPKPGEYLTFKQIQDLKGCIKKGSKANMVVFWKISDKKTTDSEEGEETNENKTQKYFILRYYNVYHLDDVEGIESKIKDTKPTEVIKEPEPVKEPEIVIEPIETAESIIKGYVTCPPIKHTDATGAYYVPLFDYINVPPIENFPKKEDYYATSFHEMVHSTGHKDRLNRDGVKDRAAPFGSETYSKEELIAEIGNAMLCTFAGIEHKTIENSASYIKSWLNKLKEDYTLIIKASQQAQKACDYILGLGSETQGEYEN